MSKGEKESGSKSSEPKKAAGLVCLLFNKLNNRPWLQKVALSILAPAWLVASWILANFILSGILISLKHFGVEPLSLMREVVLQTVLSSLMFILTLILTVGRPFLVCLSKLSRKELGYGSYPDWKDVGFALLVLVLAMFSTAVAIVIVGQLFPGLNLATSQDVGFNTQMISHRYELILAYLVLVIIGPIIEEILFRGYLFGVLRKRLSSWVTTLIVAFVFGVLHLGIGLSSELQLNVAIDTFILSLWLGFLRSHTGSLWSSIFVHILKNGLVFFAVFVVPMTSGGAIS